MTLESVVNEPKLGLNRMNWIFVLGPAYERVRIGTSAARSDQSYIGCSGTQSDASPHNVKQLRYVVMETVDYTVA